MHRLLPHRRPFVALLHLILVSALVVSIAALALAPGTALAHNSLLSSDPADGAVLAAPPTSITWQFDKEVPLDSLTVTLIDPSGVRTELAGSAHGPGGTSQVVTPLPPLPAGNVSIRWRLVGPDGHPVTGRVELTVTSAAAATTIAPTPSDALATPPTSVAPPAAADIDDEDGSTAASTLGRWLARTAAYIAVMAVVGLLATAGLVWPGVGTHGGLQRLVRLALVATGMLAVLQLLQLAADIGATSTWSAFGSIDTAMRTDAGRALAVRIPTAAGMWLLVSRSRSIQPDVYRTATTLTAGGLLLTWALAGHSRTLRWPTAGILADVVHHAAAAAWLTGLAVVALVVIPSGAPAVVTATVQRFSRVALWCVVVLTATGIVQSVRLVGNPTRLLDAGHGRALALKLVLLVGMLALAAGNRTRVSRLVAGHAPGRDVAPIRRAVLAEFAIGLAIVGVTAAMVVSPPVTRADVAPATAVNYIV